MKRWVEYIESLYSKEEKPEKMKLEEERNIDEDDIGTSILEEEVESAVCGLKMRKAEGIDHIN